jgi:ABC-2 type transport system permease protein
MSRVMFWRALEDLRWTILWYALGLSLYAVMILSFYPTVRDNTAMMEQYIQVLPKAVMEAFGVTDMASFSGFIGGEFLNVMWPLIVSIFLIMAGAAAVAREVEHGTIELLLSAPASRTRLLTAKLAALLASILALVAVTLGALALGAALVDETLELENLMALGAVLVSFAVAVAGYSALFSSFSKERGKAAGMAAGLTIAFYLAWVVSELSEDWEWLNNLSIFAAYEPQRALESGHLELWQLGSLVGVGLVCAVAAIVIFRRRDAVP